MPLSAGTRLGPYEFLALICARGMGEAYRARYTRLGREREINLLKEIGQERSRGLNVSFKGPRLLPLEVRSEPRPVA
jgi:hypothetical protein